MKKEGLVIHNPLDQAMYMYATSKAAMRHIVVLLVDEKSDFDHNSHQITATMTGNATCSDCLEREQDFFDARWVGKLAVKRQDK